MKARDGSDLFTEHAKLLSEYDKIVTKAKRKASEKGQLTPLERWREAVKDAEASLGPLKKLALVDFKREHARKLRDDMLAAKKYDGSPLSPSSVQRDPNMVRAMVPLAIKEHDLQGQASTPFEGLEFAGVDAAPVNEFDRRDPLPHEEVLAMRQRMARTLREPVLGKP